MPWWHKFLLLSLGGALGTNARYWLSIWFSHQEWGKFFPWATLFINVSGSLVLGAAAVLFRERLSREDAYLLVGVGFCGGYTTFSTFALETFQLVRKGLWPWALANVAVSVLLAFLAVMWAIRTAERWEP